MSEDGLKIVLRPSTDEDVPTMLEIYAYHIHRGMGDFTPDPIHLDEIKRRRKVMLKRKMPHMVAESNGAIVGYAYAAPFRKRPAYRFTVEHSIYVDKDHLRLGVGRCLLPALIRECTEAGFHQMIAVIDSTNLPSLGLHEAFGFERSGLLRSVGFKFGQWTDSVLMQRLLVSEAPADAPSPNEGGDGDGESRID